MTKILLVEDDKSLREIYGVRLLAEGYDIVSAGDGEDALAMAIKEKPTLIISDVMMPKISGFDMLDILRSTTETRDIKVIMMTALSSEDQRARGEQLGADRYLVKSQVGIEDVVRTVHEVLGDVPGGAAPAAAATPAPTESPAAAVATTPSQDPAAPATESPAPTADDTASTSLAPGNDAAGPLPPQPTELAAPAPVIEPVVPLTPAPDAATETPATESTLPQPTAPFSSPRPANLGEQVIHPDDAPAADAAPADMPVVPELPVVDTPAPLPEADAATLDPVAPAPLEPATDDSTPVPATPTTPPAL
jgi:CheY-like chemotaxis protein